MDKIIKQYNEFILSTKPSKSWKVIRFFLHWLTLPLKIVLIGGLGVFQIIVKLFKKPRPISNEPVPNIVKKHYFNKILEGLPILNTTELQVYAPRVPLYALPNGYNHNPDHQCSRHATYVFLMNRLGLVNQKMQTPIDMFMQDKFLCRGIRWNPYESRIDYNVSTTSGDMLCGLNLAILSNNHPSERFDRLVENIIENDYAVVEGARPELGDVGYDLYQKLLIENDYIMERVPMKSGRGMWQPGLETVGAQALTILSSLRLAEVKNGNRNAGKEYRKLLYKYGYGLLSLFPTAYIDKQRGYFNDHNCMIALYTLSKCSKTKFGKLFWKIPMVYVWLLSKHWYNGYFTGLLKDCYPDMVSNAYIQKCQAYLYETEPNNYIESSRTEVLSKLEPVPNNLNIHDEFSPDVRQDLAVGVIDDNSMRLKTGLGFIACAIMLETDPKELL